jgi:glucose-6-phosphate isomerase
MGRTRGTGDQDQLGWLTVSETMLEHAAELHAFAGTCRDDGFTDAVLLGMGGSSLGLEVIRRSFGDIPDGLRLRVLDSTHPDVVLDLQQSVDLARTLFIVSSKSGTTIETMSHYRYFPRARWPRAVRGDHRPRQLARDDRQRQPVPTLLPEPARHHYDSSESNESNAGLWLGAAIGELARHGRDKLTFVVSPPIESFGLWVEQLIAGSTGKRGRGIVPVVDELLAAPEACGHDRVIIYLRKSEEPLEDLDEQIGRLTAAGHPTLTVSTHGPADLGRIFFLSEFATAVAGWVLEINPFRQPNVQEAKDTTRRVLETGSATTVGYGPRYLHSTGQLHKGAPPPDGSCNLSTRPDATPRSAARATASGR